MDGIISKRYGRAMFELAKTENKIEEYLKQLRVIKDITIENPKLLEMFDHPKVTIFEKFTLIDDLFKDGFDKEVRDFLKLLVTKDRINYIVGMIQDYEELYYEYMNIVVVSVTSAVELDEEEKSALMIKLEGLFEKKVIIDQKTDPAIIGGLRIAALDKVIDATVKGRLEKVRQNLLQEVR